MRKRSGSIRLLESPPSAKVEEPSAGVSSPMLNFAVKFDGFSDIAKSLKSRSDKGAKSRCSLSLIPIVNTVADLKGLADSNSDSLKRQLEISHREILKNFEATHCRLRKRYKIQTQACLEMVDGAEKEYTKFSDRINEAREAMKASYVEFLTEAQASTSRLHKTSIPELAKTSEKSIDSLRQRFRISTDDAA